MDGIHLYIAYISSCISWMPLNCRCKLAKKIYTEYMKKDIQKKPRCYVVASIVRDETRRSISRQIRKGFEIVRLCLARPWMMLMSVTFSVSTYRAAQLWHWIQFIWLCPKRDRAAYWERTIFVFYPEWLVFQLYDAARDEAHKTTVWI